MYIIDMPGRGRFAGNLSKTDVPQLEGDDKLWNVWRPGHRTPPGEPTFFEGLQFPTNDGAAVDRGLHGNTHFPFSDLNNVEVTELFIDYLKSRDLA